LSPVARRTRVGLEAAYGEAVAREHVLGGPDEELEAAALGRGPQSRRARLVGREHSQLGGYEGEARHSLLDDAGAAEGKEGLAGEARRADARLEHDRGQSSPSSQRSTRLLASVRKR
jgi:hypothetical protein